MSLAVTVLLSGLAGMVSQATMQFDPVAIVEKAIAAHGGKESLQEVASAFMSRRRITKLKEGKKQSIEVTTWFKAPCRIKVVVEEPGQAPMVHVVNNELGRFKCGDGPVQPLPPELLKEYHRRFEQEGALSLVPLMDSRRFQMTPKRIATVRQKPCYEIAVATKGQEIVTLYIDCTTYRFVKVSGTTTRDGKRGRFDVFVDQYRQFGKVAHAQKLTSYWCANLLSETEVLEYRPDQPRDDEFFSKIE